MLLKGIKRLFICLLTLSASSNVFAAKPIFEVPYDGTPDAEFAKGEKKPFALGYDAERYVSALNGKGARIGKWESQQRPGTLIREDRLYFYKYPAKDNFNINSGSMSFWIKPENWDGNDALPSRLFVSMRGYKHALLVYKLNDQPVLFFYSKANLASPTPSDNNSVAYRISDWKKGEWHFVVCSWTEKSMSLYVDGQRAAFGSRKAFTDQLFEICVGFNPVWEAAKQKDLSVISDFKIFDSPLSNDEIEKAWITKGGSLTSQRSNSSITAGYSTANVDGVINKDEYAFSGTGFYDTNTGEYARKQSNFYLGRDDKYLYVAWQSPNGGSSPMKSLSRNRDEKVWEDDCVELHLQSPEKVKYQFIINPNGVVYDSRSSNPAWNCSGLKIANKDANGVWICEAAILLKDLGVAGDMKNWEVNVCRTFYVPNRLTSCIAPVARMIGYADVARYFLLTFDQKAPRLNISSIGDLNNYQFDFKASVKENSGDNISAKVTGASGEQPLRQKNRDGSIMFTCRNASLPQKGKVTVTLLSEKCGPLYHTTFKIPDLVELSLLYVYTDIPKKVFNISLNSMLPPDGRGKLNVKVLQKGKMFLERSYEMKSPNPDFEIPIDIKDWAPGDYMIMGFHDNGRGQVKKIVEEGLRIPTNPAYFETYPILLEHKVPAPWTPLKYDKSKGIYSDCSDYLLGDSMLFTQITSLGRPMLKAPIDITVDGNRNAENVKTQLLKNDGVEAFLRTTGTVGDVAICTDLKVEFDGLVHVTLTFSPKNGKSVRVNNVTMNIPFDPECAKFVNGLSRASTRRFGEKPWTQNLFRMFTFWTGDEDVGFNFLAKDLKGWYCKDMVNSLMISTQNGIRNASFHLVDTPVMLDKPRTIKFAFMATPGRKLKNKFTNIDHRQQQMFRPGFVTKYFNWNDPDYLFQPIKPGNIREFNYDTITGTSPHSPEWNYWGVQWKMGQKIGVYDEDYPVKSLAERNLRHYVHACLNSKSFAKFKMATLDEFIKFKPFNVHNIYFDLAKVDPCDSLDHGCGWTDEFGRPQCSFPWYELRQQMRAARQILTQAHPEGRISMHTGDQRIQPIMVFVDCSVGGEDFVSEVGTNGNYYDILNPDILASYSLPLGMVGKNFFIPQFARSLTFVAPGKKWDAQNPENLRATRHLIGYLILLDYGVFGEKNESLEYDSIMNAFGWTPKTEFVPYWRKNFPISISQDLVKNHVYCSAYVNPGRAMLVILNDTDKAGPVTLTVDFNRLIGSIVPSRITDFYHPEAKISCKDGTIKLDMMAREVKYLFLDK